MNRTTTHHNRRAAPPPRWRRYCAGLLLAVLPSVCAGDSDALAALGQRLFFDPDLSAGRTQSCATCHDPERAFSDGREGGVGGAVSLGDDGHSLGDRNTPSISYAALVPEFVRSADGYRGGLFHDGRAADLAVQAAEPILNPLEMAMPDEAAVIARLRQRADYASAFESLFGVGILATPAAAYAAMTRAIAAFEQGPPFVAFDSRYDRFLRGEASLTQEEELGRRLYFSDLTNCQRCHLLEPNRIVERESFTDHRYHNIGIPPNHTVRAVNGTAPGYRDRGLGQHPAIDDPAVDGRFRTPTLRNIAVTAPYMHNGVFQRLETALHFYNQYIVRNAAVDINPETGAAWGAPEIGDNVALDLLREGHPLDAERIDTLIAFLRTLTDRRYEHLLPATQPDTGGHR